jgi:hypothetical protein
MRERGRMSLVQRFDVADRITEAIQGRLDLQSFIFEG